jgi:hypothetical protein
MLREVKNIVGWVAEISDTFQIQFSENNLQKGLVFILIFLETIYTLGQAGYHFL